MVVKADVRIASDDRGLEVFAKLKLPKREAVMSSLRVPSILHVEMHAEYLADRLADLIYDYATEQKGIEPEYIVEHLSGY